MRGPGGELLASFVDGETPSPRYYHFDQLGNMVLLTNGSGVVYSGKTYDAWGNRVDGGASTTSPYQYVGELGYYTHTYTQGPTLDDLLQLGVRFYDPEIGRFTQRDAIPVVGSEFSYVSGEPTTNVDPSGLKRKKGKPKRPQPPKPPKKPGPIKPGPGLGGVAKLLGALGSCWFAACGGNITHIVNQDCGLGWADDKYKTCVCKSLDDLLQGLLIDSGNSSGPIDDVGIGLGTWCAKGAYAAVDQLVDCDRRLGK